VLTAETVGAAVTVKLAELAPCGTTTEAGTVAAAVFELDRATVIPPAGAGPLRVTRPAFEEAPLIRDAGADMEIRAVGPTVTVAVCTVVPRVAVMVTLVAAAATPVVNENCAELAPPGTVTVAGTETSAGFELDMFTTAPPARALPLRFTRFPPMVRPPATFD